MGWNELGYWKTGSHQLCIIIPVIVIIMDINNIGLKKNILQ